MEVYLPHRPKGMDGGVPYQDMYNREVMQGMGEHLLQKSCNAEVIISNQAPYRIKAANDAWVNMLGFRCADHIREYSLPPSGPESMYKTHTLSFATFPSLHLGGFGNTTLQLLGS